MSKNRIIIVISLLILSLALTSMSVAWFVNDANNEVNINASSIPGYFGGGTGTVDDPYLLKVPKHVYNLAWLQDRGYFNDNEEEEKTYFMLYQDIDMKGALSGDESVSGAVPPIGTATNPFLGEFIGNGKVIENLWVSSDVNDWYEKPQGVADLNIGDHVGFFGVVGNQEDGFVGTAHDFILKNLEVSSHLNSTIGLIAGYANGDMQRIGVENGIISIKGSKTVKSEMVLVGEVGPLVQWRARPGAVGDQLVIDATDGFTNVTSGVREVPESSDRAYFLASLSGTSCNPNPNPTKIYQLNELVQWDGTTATSRSATTTSNQKNYTAVFSGSTVNPALPADNPAQTQLVTDLNKTISNFIAMPTNAPSVTAASSQNTTVAETVGGNIQGRAQNGIYFKPTSIGVCSIAIAKTDNKGDACLSVYSFKRGADNKVPQFSEWKELKLTAVKDGTLGTGYVIVFNINLGTDALGREFVVGRSSNLGNKVSSAGFVYLILAGAGNTGDIGSGRLKIIDVDYAYDDGAGYDVLKPLPEGQYYDPKNLALNFGFSDQYTTSGDTVFRFNTGVSDSITVVYYDGAPTVEDSVKTATVGVFDSSNSHYPPRLNVASP